METLSTEALKLAAEHLIGISWSDEDLEVIGPQVKKWHELIMALNEVEVGEAEPAVSFEVSEEGSYDRR